MSDHAKVNHYMGALTNIIISNVKQWLISVMPYIFVQLITILQLKEDFNIKLICKFLIFYQNANNLKALSQDLNSLNN